MREVMPKHRCLREILRNYLTLKDASENDDYTITVCRIKGCIWTNGEVSKGHDGPCEMLTVNFLDLRKCLQRLSKRKMEAVFWNVIMDKKQRDVAEIMDITTVSIGQYVESACTQVANDLWGSD